MNLTLQAACRCGHKDAIELMIGRGADNWNWGLIGASEGGNKDIVKLMIEKGADDLIAGKHVAKRYEIIELLKSYQDR